MKGDHAPTFDIKLGFVDGMLFKSRFPRVAEYLSTVGTGAFVTPGPVAVNKTLETSILWNPSAATISQALSQGLLQGGAQVLQGLQFQALGGLAGYLQ